GLGCQVGLARLERSEQFLKRNTLDLRRQSKLDAVGFVGDCDHTLYRPICRAHGRVFQAPYAAIEVQIALEIAELETFHTTSEQADFTLRGKGVVPLR